MERNERAFGLQSNSIFNCSGKGKKNEEKRSFIPCANNDRRKCCNRHQNIDVNIESQNNIFYRVNYGWGSNNEIGPHKQKIGKMGAIWHKSEPIAYPKQKSAKNRCF